jgi:hypothetical protein
MRFTRPRDLLVLAARYSEEKGASVAALDLLAGADGEALLEAPFEAAPGVGSLGVGEDTWPCLVRQVSGLPPLSAGAAREATRWYAAAPRTERPPERPSGEPLGRRPASSRSEAGGRKPWTCPSRPARRGRDPASGRGRFGPRVSGSWPPILGLQGGRHRVARDAALSLDALKAWLDAAERRLAPRVAGRSVRG